MTSDSIPLKEIPRFKSISGFALQCDVITILSLYNKGADVIAPQFIPIKNELCTGRTGFYVGMVACLDEKDMETIEHLLEDCVVIELNPPGEIE